MYIDQALTFSYSYLDTNDSEPAYATLSSTGCHGNDGTLRRNALRLH